MRYVVLARGSIIDGSAITKTAPEEAEFTKMVNLTTKQVETFFGELEYIEPRLKALGVAVDEEVDHV